MKILDIPFGSTSFDYYFLQKALGEDVWHVDVFFRLRGCPNDFWFFLFMFHSKAFIFASLFPPFLVYQSQFIFLFHPYGNFGEAFKFDLGSLKCREAFLVRQ